MDQETSPKLLVAIQIIQVANYNRLVNNEDKLFYDIYRLYLNTQDLILNYAHATFGTFVSIGNGRFMIFSTNDQVVNRTRDAALLLDRIRDLTQLNVYMGIGYGQTAMEAERHARIAINHAEASGGNACIYIVDEHGTVDGPLDQADQLHYRYRTENPDLVAHLSHAGVNVVTFEKMLALQNACSDKLITAALVANALGMTSRNARKILSSLSGCGLAEPVGTETLSAKGRPRQVFRVKSPEEFEPKADS